MANIPIFLSMDLYSPPPVFLGAVCHSHGSNTKAEVGCVGVVIAVVIYRLFRVVGSSGVPTDVHGGCKDGEGCELGCGRI